MPTNRYAHIEPTLDAPATGAFNITPDDDTDLTVLPRAIYVGGAGDLEVVMDGITVVFVGASGFLPIRPTRVKDANTTATNIVGLI